MVRHKLFSYTKKNNASAWDTVPRRSDVPNTPLGLGEPSQSALNTVPKAFVQNTRVLAFLDVGAA